MAEPHRDSREQMKSRSRQLKEFKSLRNRVLEKNRDEEKKMVRGVNRKGKGCIGKLRCPAARLEALVWD